MEVGGRREGDRSEVGRGGHEDNRLRGSQTGTGLEGVRGKEGGRGFLTRPEGVTGGCRIRGIMGNQTGSVVAKQSQRESAEYI